ncbi:DUF6328 family protein [Luethyella okanaganae]|uniref:DUF6328 family protein n=1 Tax=Luethyella okanaganae TaxID=69372 RepID=A0ABW1VF83_9MICO
MEPDAAPGDGRAESASSRADRNWNDILQEVRVTQAGTQILTGFLLAIAFQPRFALLDAYQHVLYLCLVVVAVSTTALSLLPVSLHRLLFHRQVKSATVRFGDLVLRFVLVGVALTLSGTIMLIFDVAVSRLAGLVAGATAAALAVVLGVVVPLLVRAASHRMP